MYESGYAELYKNRVASDYSKRDKPSIDRINDNKGYSIDNIRLTTWGKNKDKQTQDMLKGRGTSGVRCMKIGQYTTDDKLMNEFHSQSEASRATGVCSRGISRVVNGKGETAGGFIWRAV